MSLKDQWLRAQLISTSITLTLEFLSLTSLVMELLDLSTTVSTPFRELVTVRVSPI